MCDVMQAHDPKAEHIKRWLPELQLLPPRLALEPWRLLMVESLEGENQGLKCDPDFMYGEVYPFPCVRPLVTRQ